MATEITCIIPDPDDPGRRIDRVGGPGWTKDEDTVIGEIEEGWRYYVRLGDAQVNIVLTGGDRCPALRTDPAETARNELLSLPPCI